ncbi:tRNA pseudouridine(55) synthase TruB [bacterium]|nr:tRNA pseudouridine(55) synthase TruB [bacterium]
MKANKTPTKSNRYLEKSTVKNSTHEFPLITTQTLNSIFGSVLLAVDRTAISNFFDHGTVILVNKPAGWTSFDVVNKIRNITRAKKVGHCGTLDPFATGLLIVCTGKATKTVDTFAGLSKTYLNEFELGKTTDTLDCDGAVIDIGAVGDYTIEKLAAIAMELAREVEQMPPAYSAIKVNGTPSYKLARKGHSPDLKPRKILIELFDILDYKKPIMQTRIRCSKGTYVRAIARDFGNKIGCGAYVKSLKRESIGTYSCDDALSIEQIALVINSLKSANAHSN